MAEKLLRMKHGFLPYADGSGYEVTVEVTLESETAAPEISISTVGGFHADGWPAVRDGIERLLKALP